MGALIALLIAPPLLGISLSIAGYTRIARHSHWQIATMLLLAITASKLAGLHMHRAWDDRITTEVAAKTATWAVAILGMIVAIHAPLAVRCRGEKPDPPARGWNPASVFEQWRLRHSILAGAAMTMLASSHWPTPGTEDQTNSRRPSVC